MSYKPERALTRLIPVCYWGAMNFRRNELQAREGIDTEWQTGLYAGVVDTQK